MIDVNLLNPSAFSLLFLPGLFIVFYILQGGKKEKEVTSLIFWQQIEENSHSFNVKFKFKTDLLFWLQLIIILLLIFTLFQPVITEKNERRNRVIIVIDRSASMKAEDIGNTRFSLAIKKAINKVNRLSSGTEIALLSADSNPVMLVDFSFDREIIKEKLRQLKVTDVEVNIKKTLELVESYKNKDDKVFFFTDAAFSYYDDFPENTELMTVGEKANNMAISNFSVREKSGLPGQYSLFLELANFSDKEKEIALEIKRGRLLIIRDRLKINANEKAKKEYDLRINEAVDFEIDLKNEDILSADNSVKFRLGEDLDDNFKVLYLGKDNYFLERAFLVIPGINLIKMKDNPEISLEKLNSGDYDLYIFNEKKIPDDFRANILLINPSIENFDYEENNKEEVIEIMTWEKENPLFRFVNLQGLKLKGANYDYIRENGTPIARTMEGAIISVERQNLYRRVNIGFSLDQSNFSLQAGFPIFLINMIKWLRPDFQTPAYSMINTGDKYRYYPPAGEKIEKVISPKGNELSFTKIADSYLIENTVNKGIYTIVLQNGEKNYFSANLLSEEESKLNQKYEMKSVTEDNDSSKGKTSLEKQDSTTKTVVKNEEVILKRLWPYIILVVIIFLLFEWYIFQKNY
ncbi:MAG: vWA domain-containing protein [Bacillota bacterium]